MGFIDNLRTLLGDDGTDDNPPPESAQRLAFAALLVEIGYADHALGKAEQKVMRQILMRRFVMSTEAADALLQQARERSEHSVSMHPDVSMIRTELSREERISVVDALWRVAYADGQVDPQEEHLVRRLADLLGVPHAEFIRSRHRVESA